MKAKVMTRLCIAYGLLSVSLFAWCAGEALSGRTPSLLLQAMLLAGCAWGVWVCLPEVSNSDDTERLSRIVLGLAERVAAQSELLARKAEKDDRRYTCEMCKLVLHPDERTCYLDTRDGEKWFCVDCAMDHDWGDELTAESEAPK